MTQDPQHGGGIPLAPRLCAQREAAQRDGRQVLAVVRPAQAPFVLRPIPAGTRAHIEDVLERIVGRVPPGIEWDVATHLLVCEEVARDRTRWWGIPVLGAPAIRSEEHAVLAAYMGIAQGPLAGPGVEEAQVRCRPLLRLLVRWGAPGGGVIHGAELPVRAPGWWR
ncbi:MAG: hypothetical protein WC683_01105 [bacterium]